MCSYIGDNLFIHKPQKFLFERVACRYISTWLVSLFVCFSVAANEGNRLYDLGLVWKNGDSYAYDTTVNTQISAKGLDGFRALDVELKQSISFDARRPNGDNEPGLLAVQIDKLDWKVMQNGTVVEEHNSDSFQNPGLSENSVSRLLKAQYLFRIDSQGRAGEFVNFSDLASEFQTRSQTGARALEMATKAFSSVNTLVAKQGSSIWPSKGIRVGDRWTSNSPNKAADKIIPRINYRFEGLDGDIASITYRSKVNKPLDGMGPKGIPGGLQNARLYIHSVQLSGEIEFDTGRQRLVEDVLEKNVVYGFRNPANGKPVRVEVSEQAHTRQGSVKSRY